MIKFTLDYLDITEGTLDVIENGSSVTVQYPNEESSKIVVTNELGEDLTYHLSEM
eukprot:CAMPEP_0176403208 /NCGR_PEP_ID=MMETSP0126-20121128/49910_1 /TAXON_ID=141414 ORGANISM="Strombidinopsis acuminatum, Strain SPMC142" /NCGR_SAMPLE_ID=MMETSP0126 /ASSEMBLY_ACC=CAM_ASM_000229 /LENGTH=54 /DNA_ID=CAMNT_0017781319 /DNA_START=228 /DNA_END=392 /DNA_ORIENTATION=+